MSQRNTLEAKRNRRAGRTLAKGRVPAKIDLVEWIKMRSNVTTGTALRLLAAGVLRVDSHNLTKRYVSADLRGRITIHAPS